MERLRVVELLKATGGELVSGDGHAWITGIATDSRRIRDGEFFVPLVGERFDGHDFIKEALRRGASGVLASRRHVGRLDLRRGPEGGLPPRACIVVEETLEALHRLAHYYRRRFEIPVIAVTGSVGKTTTKDMVGSVLSQRYKTLKSWKNYNNDVGVPLTIFQLESEHQAMVLELGMRGPGEIARLARLAQPSIGVVTNVSEVHLETLGSIEAIAGAKGELVEALPRDGLAVLNGDDPHVRKMSDRGDAAVITFGMSRDRDMWAEEIRTGEDGTPTFVLNWRGERAVPSPRAADGRERKAWDPPQHRRERLHVGAAGAHQVWGAMAAALCGLYLGLEWGEVAQGLDQVETSGLRMDVWEHDGITWLNDAYNASPLSVKTALATLCGLAVDRGRPVAVLGDMLELGEASERAHREVGREVAELGISLLVTVGPAAGWIAEEAERLRPRMEVHRLTSVDGAVSFVRARGRLLRGDCVLLKASRGMALERIVEASVKGGAP